jgi:hypothetical protein
MSVLEREEKEMVEASSAFGQYKQKRIRETTEMQAELIWSCR